MSAPRCPNCGETVHYGHDFAHKNDCPAKVPTVAQPAREPAAWTKQSVENYFEDWPWFDTLEQSVKDEVVDDVTRMVRTGDASTEARVASQPSPAAEPPRDLGLCDRVKCACACREALAKEVERLTRARSAPVAVETEPSSWKLEVEALEADVARLQRCSAGNVRDVLLNAIDSPTVAALADVFNPRNTQSVLSKSYCEQIVEILEPRIRAVPQQVEVTDAAQFLLARLDEFDPGEDEPEREYHGHVAPAIARLRSALSRPEPQCEHGAPKGFCTVCHMWSQVASHQSNCAPTQGE